MPDFFSHYKPFIRVIENDTITTVYSAILALYNEPATSERFVPGDSTKTLGVLEDIGQGSYVHVSYQAVGYFEKVVTAFANLLIISIDETLMNSENKKVIQENLNNYRSYTYALIERFGKKDKQVAKLLKIIPIQLTRVIEALNDRISHFESNTSGNTPLQSVTAKINWLADEASLGNLFHDLLNGLTYDSSGNQTGKKFIGNEKEELAKTIVDVFVIKDSRIPNFENIKRYLRTKKKANRFPIKAVMRGKGK